MQERDSTTERKHPSTPVCSRLGLESTAEQPRGSSRTLRDCAFVLSRSVSQKCEGFAKLNEKQSHQCLTDPCAAFLPYNQPQ